MELTYNRGRPISRTIQYLVTIGLNAISPTLLIRRESACDNEKNYPCDKLLFICSTCDTAYKLLVFGVFLLKNAQLTLRTFPLLKGALHVPLQLPRALEVTYRTAQVSSGLNSTVFLPSRMSRKANITSRLGS